MTDEFKTIATTSEGYYTEKRSKFLAFAHHVQTTDEVKDIIAQYRKKYYDARCWALSGTTSEPTTTESPHRQQGSLFLDKSTPTN